MAETPRQNFAGHDIRLESERLTLRPFDDGDFDAALPYFQDPELVEALEGRADVVVDRDYLERAGDYLRRRGQCFAVELKADRRVIGELCLEWMNLARANVQPQENVMRVPLAIWDKPLWGQGYGREMLRRAMRHAFETLRIDRLCGMGVSRRNARSQGLFRSCGFRAAREMDGEIDFEILRDEYFSQEGRS